MKIQMERKRLQKTTKRQYKELLNFIEKNPIILEAKTKTLEAKINLLWENFANTINAKAIGPSKTYTQWIKVVKCCS